MRDLSFNNAHVILLEKELSSNKAQILARVKEVGDLIECRIGNPSSGSRDVSVDSSDMKWLVEQPVGVGVFMQQQAFTEAGRAIVAEMKKKKMKAEDVVREQNIVISWCWISSALGNPMDCHI
ncbi:protein SUPPRESSOR OF MAX2 1 [Senna tora]|uniref:Protein SUPPRESSOR OF MAX2 1 n=1 Tax=Senna tora TaxID=362788 RepID=A0A834WAE6_9FABA|nr:protein SUPPRESSOR OF MAX2 1 [Senna tora]